MIPTLHHHLPHRKHGSFGTSRIGRAAEFLTLNWLRFELFVVWIMVIVGAISQIIRDPPGAIMLFAFSPVAAAIGYISLKIMFVVIWFIPGPNIIFGGFRLLYIWIFCRIIVQKSPRIEIPLWAPKGLFR